MKQIRIGTFETNSSSTHSLTIVSEEDYEKWKKGELVFHKYEDKLVSLEDGYNEDLQTFEAWCEEEKEDFTERFTTKSGDKIVAFGKYGYDG